MAAGHTRTQKRKRTTITVRYGKFKKKTFKDG